jgi:hypothetical protein
VAIVHSPKVYMISRQSFDEKSICKSSKGCTLSCYSQRIMCVSHHSTHNVLMELFERIIDVIV